MSDDQAAAPNPTKMVTVKLPETTYRQLCQIALATDTSTLAVLDLLVNRRFTRLGLHRKFPGLAD
jgi:hypothetical protein